MDEAGSGLDALLVIDVQVAFVGDSAINAEVAYSISVFARRIQPTGTKIICTRFINSQTGPFPRLLKFSRMMEGDESNELVASLSSFMRESKDDVHCFDKNGYTAVVDEFLTLAETFKGKRIGICGFSTHACVLKTALDLFESGYEPIVIYDLCMSHNRDNAIELHEGALTILRKLIGPQRLVHSEK